MSVLNKGDLCEVLKLGLVTTFIIVDLNWPAAGSRPKFLDEGDHIVYLGRRSSWPVGVPMDSDGWNNLCMYGSRLYYFGEAHKRFLKAVG